MERLRFHETGIFKKPADLMQMFKVNKFLITFSELGCWWNDCMQIECLLTTEKSKNFKGSHSSLVDNLNGELV